MSRAGEFINGNVLMYELPKYTALNAGSNFLMTNVVVGHTVEKHRLFQNQGQPKAFNEVSYSKQGPIPWMDVSILGWNETHMKGDNNFRNLVSSQKLSFSSGFWMPQSYFYHPMNRQISTNNTFRHDSGVDSSMLAQNNSREYRMKNTVIPDQVSSYSCLGDQPEIPKVLPDESGPVLRESMGTARFQNVDGRFQTYNTHWQSDIPLHNSVSDSGYFPSVTDGFPYNPSRSHSLLRNFSKQLDPRLQRYQIGANFQTYPPAWRTAVKTGELSRQDPMVNEGSNGEMKNCLNQAQLAHCRSILNKSVPLVPCLLRSKSLHDYRFNTERLTVVSALCYAIKHMCRTNNRQEETKSSQPETIFHAFAVPDITLEDWLKRLAWYYDCPTESFVLALEYIHRVTNCKPEVEVNYHTAHQLVLTCIKVATKFFDDVAFNSFLYAKVVGLPATTISELEVQLLFLLSFDLFVSPKQYQSRYKEMVNRNQGVNKVIITPSSYK